MSGEFIDWLARSGQAHISEPTPWNGDDTRPMPSVQSPEDEERIERDWADFEAHARDFVKAHGLGAMLRCLSRSVEQQQELLRK